MLTDPPKQKWFQRWWGVGILAILGAVTPQLCALIPNVAGARICAVVVNAFVSGLTAPAADAPPPPAPAPVEECAPERRLSTGKCLPP